MATQSRFPILEALQISPKNIYELLSTGVECERAKLLALQALGDERESLRSSTKILQGERVLCFMRINSFTGEMMNKTP
jgi:hypothetical protein